jgi:hypothetical protein
MICNTPYCNNEVKPTSKLYTFCKECRQEHSNSVLKIQAEHEKAVRDIILDAKIFQTANGMADYIGISFVTLYRWIEKYFVDKEGHGLSFQEFRRKYICKSKKCHLLNIKRSSYSRSDYILKKIWNRNYCACTNSLSPDFIMTNAPMSLMKTIFMDGPPVQKISDDLFALMPEPVHVKEVKPVNIFNQVLKTPKRYKL